MAEESGKGSIWLKLIILILIGVLIAVLLIPKRMWDKEALNTEICHQRMSSLLAAEFLIQKYQEAYNPNLDSLIAFFKKDTQHLYLQDFVALDTFMNVQLNELVKNDSIVKTIVDTVMAETTLADIKKTILIDYFLSGAIVKAIREHNPTMTAVVNPVMDEFMDDKMAPSKAVTKLFETFKSYDVMHAINMDDSLAYAIKQLQPTLTMVHYLPRIRKIPYLASRVDSFYNCYVDSIRTCPTVGKPYDIKVQGETIIFADIHCPITSEDSLKIENDFWKKKIGGMRLQNHGSIIKNEKNWEKIQ